MHAVLAIAGGSVSRRWAVESQSEALGGEAAVVSTTEGTQKLEAAQ
jgi:hypothetical protein